MISHLLGTLIHANQKSLILSVNGVGYKVHTSPLFAIGLENKIGSTIELYTYFSVREDAQELFGFETYQELEMFELLVSISGIGPRSALGILAVAPLETLTRAISTNDLGYLTRISGIGKKTAEKILLELKDKMPKHLHHESYGQEDLDALDALIALGYTEHKAREILQAIPSDITETKAKIKEALKRLNTK